MTKKWPNKPQQNGQECLPHSSYRSLSKSGLMPHKKWPNKPL